MTVAQESSTLQQFASRFAEELEFYGANSGNGQVTGAQIGEAVMDIIRIDMRRTDILAVIEAFPDELRCLVLSAHRSPRTQWAVHRQLEMVKRIGGLSG